LLKKNFIMLRKLSFLIAALGLSALVMSQSGVLQGEVKDASNGEPVPFANVSILDGSSTVTGGMTDFDGKYNIRPIPAGTYTVEVTYMGFNTVRLNNVQIPAGRTTFQNFELSPAAEILAEVEIIEYKVPLIDKDQTESGATITSDDIAKMPGRSAAAVATTVGGVYSEDGEVGSIRGARSEGTVYYVDGIKVRGTSSVPKSAIEQVQVITGGLSANYGDATGGVISITTRGPSSKWFGGAEFVTSQFLDPYGYNLGGLMISGPIWKIEEAGQNRERTIAGFLLSVEANHIVDPRPSAVGAWVANPEVIDDIRNNPLIIEQTTSGALVYQQTDFLREENFSNINVRNNAGNKSVNIAGKIDIQPIRDLDISIGGTLDYRDMSLYSFGNQLFNYENNGRQVYNNWRVYGRLTQKFTTVFDEETKSIIRDPFYTIQVDYSRTMSNTFDDKHRDNFFDYGYVGKFDTDVETFYMYGTDSLTGLEGWIQETYFYRIEDYESGDLNPDLARYTEQYFENFGQNYYIDRNSVILRRGLLNGMSAPGIYGLWASPGNPYGSYTKSDANQFRVSASGSANIKGHEVSLGFEFEQRNDNYYGLAPFGLWDVARGYMNFHILEKDLQNPIPIYDANGVFQDTVNYPRLYNPSAHNHFDREFRAYHGYDVYGLDWIDIDAFDPSDFKLEMFSADELFNQGYNLVTYYGYDHVGNKLNYKPTLDDFFNKTNSEGVKTRPIAPFEPNYMAGYIMDKFAFRDLVFNIGVRVDRYDANQKVLKDPYLFSDAYRVGDNDPWLNQFDHPENIPDGAVVYVNDVSNPTAINGYRVGSSWYNDTGVEVENPRSIAGSGGISPYLIKPSEELDVNAFEDYKPQIDISPRIAFSFPISDIALFSAHYNVLSKRPTYSARLDPIEYYFIRLKNTDMINNPNLQTEKTIDYELGFQQRLTNTSALKISAFYREMRDMQQAIALVGAYPVNHYSYGNIDFGTIKGFSAAYDLRRTGNISMRVSYTLQFADGTGSSFESQASIIKSDKPNLRTTMPLDFDQRHSFAINLDYRYGGKASRTPYNGPKIAGRNILANTGANFTINSGSGSPYTQRDRPSGGAVIGSINGARKPWRTNINARIDRDFRFKLTDAKEEGNTERYGNLNVYLEISNLLNTLNVLNVYSYTGNADDNGFLNFAEYQQAIGTQNDEIAYRNYYAMYINSPYNYSLPRTIRLGVMFSF
jgi:hypothetical protein